MAAATDPTVAGTVSRTRCIFSSSELAMAPMKLPGAPVLAELLPAWLVADELLLAPTLGGAPGRTHLLLVLLLLLQLLLLLRRLLLLLLNPREPTMARNDRFPLDIPRHVIASRLAAAGRHGGLPPARIYKVPKGYVGLLLRRRRNS